MRAAWREFCALKALSALRTPLTIAAATCVSAATCASPPALAAGQHQIFAHSQSALMQTSLAKNSVSAWSATGATLGYAYRLGFSSAVVAQYSAVSSAQDILLHGFTAGLDYALWGGQNTFLQAGKEAFVDVEFPARVGLFVGGAHRVYNLKGYLPSTGISFEDAIPETGSLLGAVAGISAEIPIHERAAVIIKTNVILPWFTEQPEANPLLTEQNMQTGLVLEGGIGIGFLM
jgi:hypothetical protein